MGLDAEHKVDRTRYAAGPWDHEPDRVEFREHGFPCIVLRHESLGHLCGYVGVPKGHPAYGHGYETDYERDADGDWDFSKPIPHPLSNVSVHGGITYADRCHGRVCHVPQPGESDDVWWLGFDAAHHMDSNPVYRFTGIYRTVDYMRAECALLAEQLAEMVQ
jgi:hypothetical protein